MNITDKCMFVLILIISSFFIGFNIVSIIDKKMSNISIKMPNVNIPKDSIQIVLDEKLFNKLLKKKVIKK